MKYLLLLSFIALAQSRPGYDYSALSVQEQRGRERGLPGSHVAVASELGGYNSGYAVPGHISVGISGHNGAETGGILQAASNLGSISGGYQSVHKHVYVHVPPQGFEDESLQPRIHAHFSQPQKHYKIIFIKAPAAPNYRQPDIPLAPQNEEKTLIYVLSKRPEEPADIVIPSPPSTPPSKPEVYFIKYQARRESVVDGGSAGGGAGADGNLGLGGAGVDGSIGLGGAGVGGNIGVGGAGVGGNIGSSAGVRILVDEGAGDHGGQIGGQDSEGHEETAGVVVDGTSGHHAAIHHHHVNAVVAPSSNYGPPSKSGHY